MTTIREIARAKTAVDGSDSLEGQDNTGSFKTTAAAVAAAPTTSTTLTLPGAGPTDADVDAMLIIVTSSGSAGDEVLNIPSLPLDGNGQNAPNIGKRLTIVLATQTDPADRVVITNAGFTPGYGPGVIGFSSTPQIVAPGVILDYVGACAVFEWTVGAWLFIPWLSDFDDDTEYAGDTTIKGSGFSGGANVEAKDADPAGGIGGQIQILGGTGTGTWFGGGIAVRAGGATGTGPGGGITIESGSAADGSARGGNINLALGVGGAGPGTLNITNGINTPGAQAGTLTNAPSAGDPQMWLKIHIDGADYYFPGWQVL